MVVEYSKRGTISMKKTIIILTLVTILALLITAGMIVNKQTQMAKHYVKNETEENNSEDTNKNVLYKEYHLPINDNAKGALPSQTFNINPIKFTEHVYEDDKTYATYLQIDGLIDENIEKQINDRLRTEIIEFGRYAYDEIIKADKEDDYTSLSKYNRSKRLDYGDKTSQWNSCVRESILFNGNNVLSIALLDDEDNYLLPHSYIRVKFLNFNLANGAEIKIEELFTKEYRVLDAFTSALYQELAEGEIKWTENYYYNETTGEKEWWRI